MAKCPHCSPLPCREWCGASKRVRKWLREDLALSIRFRQGIPTVPKRAPRPTDIRFTDLEPTRKFRYGSQGTGEKLGI